jgi:hypothetical protein
LLHAGEAPLPLPRQIMGGIKHSRLCRKVDRRPKERCLQRWLSAHQFMVTLDDEFELVAVRWCATIGD